MLLPNATIWDTRIQAVDALLTASVDGRKEVYYLATVCQIGLEPPLVSVSPNPEYPICETIRQAGYFGVHFLGSTQGALVERCKRLDRGRPDKLGDLALEHELSANGTPLLVDCLQAFECRVEREWDSGDHRTFIGAVIARKARVAAADDERPHRFGGTDRRMRRALKRFLCSTGLYDLLARAKGGGSSGISIEQGTQLHVGEQVLWTSSEDTGDSGRGSSEEANVQAASAAAPRLAASPPGVCLVGCGWWGGVHALNLKSHGSQIRRYFASASIQKARDFARRFDGEALSGLAEALADDRVDAVVLALPHHLHASAAEQALSAGKHVLVEKPLSLKVGDAERLVALAERSGLQLAVAEQYRLSPLVQKARELLETGILGRVTIVQSGAAGTYRPSEGWKQAESTMGGGVLLDVGVHYVDMLRHMFGEPDTVWAARPPQSGGGMEGEDSVVASLHFRGGPIANLVISWSAHRSGQIPNIEIIGERGSLGLWFSKPYLVHSTPLPSGHWASRVRRALPWRVSKRIGAFLPRALEKRIPVRSADLIGSRAIIEDFVSAITTGAPAAVPGTEGLRDLKVVAAAYQALETGIPQPITTS